MRRELRMTPVLFSSLLKIMRGAYLGRRTQCACPPSACDPEPALCAAAPDLTPLLVLAALPAAGFAFELPAGRGAPRDCDGQLVIGGRSSGTTFTGGVDGSAALVLDSSKLLAGRCGGAAGRIGWRN